MDLGKPLLDGSRTAEEGGEGQESGLPGGASRNVWHHLVRLVAVTGWYNSPPSGVSSHSSVCSSIFVSRDIWARFSDTYASTMPPSDAVVLTTNDTMKAWKASDQGAFVRTLGSRTYTALGW